MINCSSACHHFRHLDHFKLPKSALCGGGEGVQANVHHIKDVTYYQGPRWRSDVTEEICANEKGHKLGLDAN